MTDRDLPEAWVSMPSSQELSAKMRDAGIELPYDTSFFPAMSRLIRTHWRIGLVYGPLFHEVMMAPGYLTRAERELVATVASAAQDCHY